MMFRGRGLTLVELLFVLAMVGSLLFLSARGYYSFLENARKDTVEVDMRSVKAGVSSYFIEYNYLPVTEDQIAKSTGFRVGNAVLKDGVTRYDTLTKEDTWGNGYRIYVYEGDNENPAYFAFISAGKDGSFSGNIDSIGDDVMYVYFPVK